MLLNIEASICARDLCERFPTVDLPVIQWVVNLRCGALPAVRESLMAGDLLCIQLGVPRGGEDLFSACLSELEQDILLQNYFY